MIHNQKGAGAKKSDKGITVVGALSHTGVGGKANKNGGGPVTEVTGKKEKVSKKKKK